MQLADPAAQRGFRLETFESLASTNDEAMNRARAGDPGRLWITAARQTGGKGRLGRTWVSPEGNLYASLLLLNPAPAERAPELGFVAGVALACTLTRLLGSQLRLKWPNDAIVNGAKIAGILLEATQTRNGALACVIGIGVNCASHPGDLAYAATDLRALGTQIEPRVLLQGLAEEFAGWLDRWDEGRGFGLIRTAWLSFAAGIGEPAEVTIGAQRLKGTLRGLDERGRLLLDTDMGQRIIDAGDVFLPNAGAVQALQHQGWE